MTPAKPDPVALPMTLEQALACAEGALKFNVSIGRLPERNTEAIAVLARYGSFLRAAMEYNRLMLRDSRNAMRLGISEEIHLARGAMYDAYRKAVES